MLRDRDTVTTQFSGDYELPAPLLARPAYYELDVRVDGTRVTWSDHPQRFLPANQPGLPVRIRFQASDRGGNRGPWRDLVSGHVPGVTGLGGDDAASFRFQLLFDRSVASTLEVEKLRVVLQ